MTDHSSPVNADVLRDQIAERIWRAEYRRATGKERSIEWAEVGHREVVQYLYVADAIIQLPCISIRAQQMRDPSLAGAGAKGALDWAVSRWNAEVKNRPLVNVHRRSLDTTWRQVIRYLGGDDEGLCGPPHDELASASTSPESQS